MRPTIPTCRRASSTRGSSSTARISSWSPTMTTSPSRAISARGSAFSPRRAALIISTSNPGRRGPAAIRSPLQEVDPRPRPLDRSTGSPPTISTSAPATWRRCFSPRRARAWRVGRQWRRPVISFGWNAFEKQQVFDALGNIPRSSASPMSRPITSRGRVPADHDDVGQFRRLFLSAGSGLGDAQGIGAFNVDSGGWNFDQQQSLVKGGYAFSVDPPRIRPCPRPRPPARHWRRIGDHGRRHRPFGSLRRLRPQPGRLHRDVL